MCNTIISSYVGLFYITHTLIWRFFCAVKTAEINEVITTGTNGVDRSELLLPEIGKPIRVCLRVRPLSTYEQSRRSQCCVSVEKLIQRCTVSSPFGGDEEYIFDQVR